MRRCFIFAGSESECFIPSIKSEDYIIAADKGYSNCKKLGFIPNIAVGDWDSLGNAPNDCAAVNLPVKKDDTDTLSAIKIGIEKGFDEYHILFGTGGGRIDHTIANMQSLVFLSKLGKRGYLYFKEYVITAVTNGSLHFMNSVQGNISVFSADGIARGVYEKGLLYSLDNAELTSDYPIGVSNSFAGKESEISVTNGTLYVVFPKEAFPVD